jgi:hypothetical protein
MIIRAIRVRENNKWRASCKSACEAVQRKSGDDTTGCHGEDAWRPCAALRVVHSPTLCCVCGGSWSWRGRSIFLAQPYSLECPNLLKINTVMYFHCLLYTGYHGGQGTTVLNMQGTTACSCLFYIYLQYTNTSTIRPQHYCIIISSSKARPTRVGHVHRPISAAGHAPPTIHYQRPCRTLYIRHFRSWRRWPSWLLTTTYEPPVAWKRPCAVLLRYEAPRLMMMMILRPRP